MSTAGVSLVTVLNELRSMQATDPRDKVYAALGLADIDARTTLVDYHMPVEDVYSSVAQRAIETSQSFQILAYCRFPPKLAFLPTWVTDWSDVGCNDWITLPQRGINLTNWTRNQSRLYHISKDSKHYVRFECHGRRMIVRGIVLGKLAFTSTCGIRKLDVVTSEQRQSLDLQIVARCTKKYEEIWDCNEPIYLEARWLHEWASSQSISFIENLPLISRSKLLLDPRKGDETIEELVYRPTNESLKEAYRRLLTADVFSDKSIGQEKRRSEEHENPLPWYLSFDEQLSFRYEGRALGVSDQGFIALVPAEARVHDVIVIVQGSELPFILRPSNDAFLFIGQAYVHGVMDGEFWKYVEDGSIHLREISII